MQPYLIAVIGAHGTGKTTLAEILFERTLRLLAHTGKTLTVVKDVARECVSPVGRASTIEAQEWIFGRQADLERAPKHDVVIFDNCLLGHYAYYAHWCGEHRGHQIMAGERAAKYDLMLYLPPAPQLLIDDGLRPTDPAFQIAIDTRLRKLLELVACPHVTLPLCGSYVRAEKAWRLLKADLIDRRLRQISLVLGFVICSGRLLVTERHDPDVPDADGRWDVIAGKQEFGEEAEQALRREAIEEVGLELGACAVIPLFHSFVWSRAEAPFQSILLGYLAVMKASDCPTINARVAKIRSVRWVSRDELLSLELLPTLRPFLPHVRPHLI